MPHGCGSGTRPTLSMSTCEWPVMLIRSARVLYSSVALPARRCSVLPPRLQAGSTQRAPLDPRSLRPVPGRQARQMPLTPLQPRQPGSPDRVEEVPALVLAGAALVVAIEGVHLALGFLQSRHEPTPARRHVICRSTAARLTWRAGAEQRQAVSCSSTACAGRCRATPRGQEAWGMLEARPGLEAGRLTRPCCCTARPLGSPRLHRPPSPGRAAHLEEGLLKVVLPIAAYAEHHAGLAGPEPVQPAQQLAAVSRGAHALQRAPRAAHHRVEQVVAREAGGLHPAGGGAVVESLSKEGLARPGCRLCCRGGAHGCAGRGQGVARHRVARSTIAGAQQGTAISWL